MNFSEYLDGISNGDTVPAISGVITKITDPTEDNNNIQSISIEDEDSKVMTVKLDAYVYVAHPKKGNILHAASKAIGKSAATGLTFKRSSKTGKEWITATKGAVISHTEDDTSANIEDEHEEPKTDFEVRIGSYLLDRFHIFEFCKRMRDKHCPDFPEAKLPELATSLHMECMHKSIIPRPNKEQAKRKEVHKERAEKKPEPPKKAAAKERDWRDSAHPMAGTKLGSESAEKIATVLWPWALRQASIGGKPEMCKYAGDILEAVKDLDMTEEEMFDSYVVKYAHDDEPNSEKRRGLAINNFYEHLEKWHKYSENKPKAIHKMFIDRTFAKEWATAQGD